MKITSIDVFDFAKCLNYEDCAPICIRINTDAGISGFGEVGLAYGNAHYAGVGMVRDFGQLIIGMDPLRSEAIREKLFRTTFWGMGGGTVINAGMSAIDIALWDIKGKYYNVPVYQMLGGKTNDKLRAYASQIQFDWDLEDRNMVTPEQYAEAAKKAMAQGYTAVKVDPVGVAASGNWQRTKQDADWRLRGQLPQNVLELVRARLKAIRDLDSALDIIIELHSFTDTSTAIQLANYIDDLNIMYYEEPVHPLNAVSMRARGRYTCAAAPSPRRRRCMWRPSFPTSSSMSSTPTASSRACGTPACMTICRTSTAIWWCRSCPASARRSRRRPCRRPLSIPFSNRAFQYRHPGGSTHCAPSFFRGLPQPSEIFCNCLLTTRSFRTIIHINLLERLV